MKKPEINVICINDKDYEHVDHIDTVYDSWYFHGKLEKDLGYDIGSVTGIPDEYMSDIEVEGHKLKLLNIEGIFNVRVHNVNKSCIGYFWKGTIGMHECQRGLIVYADDTVYKKDAVNKYNTKENIL